MKQVKHFDDLRFTVVAVPDEYFVHFAIYNIEESTDGGATRLYHADGGGSKLTSVSDIDRAEIYLSGHVKYDGCSNWNFDEQNRVPLHECDREGLERYGQVLARCWDWASELLENWDG